MKTNNTTGLITVVLLTSLIIMIHTSKLRVSGNEVEYKTGFLLISHLAWGTTTNLWAAWFFISKEAS